MGNSSQSVQDLFKSAKSWVLVGTVVTKSKLQHLYGHSVVNYYNIHVFTALHGMQSRYSDGNSVCPSVCQTRAL